MNEKRKEQVINELFSALESWGDDTILEDAEKGFFRGVAWADKNPDRETIKRILTEFCKHVSADYASLPITDADVEIVLSHLKDGRDGTR